MPEHFDYDVFVSHSTKDKAVVRPLADRLRKDHLKVWFDEWVLKPGDSIPAKIQEGLEFSRVLVLTLLPISHRANVNKIVGRLSSAGRFLNAVS
jgi:hypothetical protein